MYFKVMRKKILSIMDDLNHFKLQGRNYTLRSKFGKSTKQKQKYNMTITRIIDSSAAFSPYTKPQLCDQLNSIIVLKINSSMYEEYLKRMSGAPVVDLVAPLAKSYLAIT